MATTTPNVILGDPWVEVASGPVNIVMVSGSAFWAFNGPSTPVDNQGFIPLTEGYGYGGTEKTFCRIAGVGTGLTVTVSVTAIL